MNLFSITASSLIEVTIQKLFDSLDQELMPVIQDSRERRAVIRRLLGHYFGVDATDFILNSMVSISPILQRELLDAIGRLQNGMPIQYVMGEAYFAGQTFKVTPDVLIPRGETEEWVVFLTDNIAYPTSILDIGTGSGCIAITLKQKFPQASVDAIDISKEALKIAVYNATQLNTDVHFIEMDILTDQLPDRCWSLIVSNPPYVKISEQHFMKRNVLDYEPHLALFVDDADPLLFHRHIASLSIHHLTPNGILCLEINETLSRKVVDLLHELAFRTVVLHKDMHGKDRWVMATL
ncbi:peptide chain release factor N(5)-glutamine methyltransferase [Cardinium endosymbiont of Culicoides punctatus]|uniref:peptide chain release factor N(5)-glutamine methyltransferase n=1 Tax=Cardinium endosymbiont of Culicoides punctatus TaxID=2304601 RepID=UPI001058F156|nr:peptide chain release factor N(5)-glutamine methyltransferase [Cardinium endosymbiont of Culicoides punctatus]TDG94785.1 50S ribosomal protein L3 glutamine methyltransferase [Cardinium endosymbiont of Culicoides punctatus]